MRRVRILKGICSWMLSSVLVLNMLAVGDWFGIYTTKTAQAASTVDTDTAGSTYQVYYDEDGNYTGCTLLSFSTLESGAVEVPSSLYGGSCPVTAVGDNAFLERNGISSVVLPDSITSIGNSAFAECDSLTSIMIPDSVTTIGDEAFYYCSSLVSISLPASLKQIGASAFGMCTKLSSVTIPDGTVSIRDKAFSSCSNLVSISIPDSVTEFGSDLFRNCVNITIYCNTGSGAAAYAQEVGKNYVLLDAPEETPAPQASVTPNATAKTSQPPAMVQTDAPGEETKAPTLTLSPTEGVYETIPPEVIQTPTVTPGVEPAASESPKASSRPTATTPSKSQTPQGTFSPSGGSDSGTTTPAPTAGINDSLKVTGVTAKATYNVKSGYKYTPVVKVSWKQNSQCSGYEVMRRKGVSGEFSVMVTITSNKKSSYVDKTVEKGAVYYYVVRGYKENSSNETVAGDVADAQKVSVNKKVMTPQVKIKRKGEDIKIVFKKAEGSVYQMRGKYVDKKYWGDTRTGKVKKSIYYYDVTIKNGVVIRIRTVVNVAGKKVYSGWSKGIIVR